MALDALPEFKAIRGDGPHLRGAISISPSVEYMERAYDAAKYGQFSRRPYIDIVIPSLTDPSVAPPGKHVMSCFVQYAPYHLGGRHVGQATRSVRRHGDRYDYRVRAEFRSIILHRQVLTPLDIEREFGLTEGNIFQGELTLEQLFFLRPAPGWAQYRTPIRNLYMCGSSPTPAAESWEPRAGTPRGGSQGSGSARVSRVVIIGAEQRPDGCVLPGESRVEAARARATSDRRRSGSDGRDRPVSRPSLATRSDRSDRLSSATCGSSRAASSSSARIRGWRRLPKMARRSSSPSITHGRLKPFDGFRHATATGTSRSARRSHGLAKFLGLCLRRRLHRSTHPTAATCGRW